MAEIIEGTPVEPGEDDEVLDLFAQSDDGTFDVTVEDAQVQGQPEATKEPQQDASATDTDEEGEQIPDKFRNKTKAEIAASYAELEREFGRRNNELGDLRKITDDILRSQLDPDAGGTTDDSDTGVSADDLLSNPEEVIRKVIENDPSRKAAAAAAAANTQATKLEAFKVAHPDAKTLMATDDFATWLNKVPSRASRFNAADAQLDWDVANEVITTYKEVIAVSQATADTERQQALQDVQNAPANAQAGGKKRKLLKKDDIWKLKKSNPARYEQLQPVILKAYAEGRVI